MKNKDSVYLVLAILVVLSLFIIFSISNKFITKQQDIKKSPGIELEEDIQLESNHIYKTEIFSGTDKLMDVTNENFKERILNFLASNYNIDTNGLEFEKDTGEASTEKFVYFNQKYKGIQVYNSRSVFLIRNNKLDFMKKDEKDFMNVCRVLNLSTVLRRKNNRHRFAHVYS